MREIWDRSEELGRPMGVVTWSVVVKGVTEFSSRDSVGCEERWASSVARSHRFEKRISSQMIGVILIGVAKRNLDDPPQNLLVAGVNHAPGIALIGHQASDDFANPQTLYGLPKQHGTAIGGNVLGRKVDVDGKFGVEIEAGFRVTLS